MSLPPEPSRQLEESRQATVTALRQVDDSSLIQLSRLTLPQIRAIQQEIAQVLPAGNLPAFVLSGLVKLKGRQVSADQVRQDVTALLRGVSLLPQGLYSVFIAGPAAVLYAYQKLLQLAGKDLESAFPQGTWQFYLQFGLREDTARHVCETTGFHRALPAPPETPDALARAAAWLCAALETIHRYDDLLAADWAERVTLRLLQDEAAAAGLADQPLFTALALKWHAQRPYTCPAGVDYLSHRRAVFQKFLQERLDALPADSQTRLRQRYHARQAEELAAYQEQMTLLAALTPERFQDVKKPIPLWQAAVAFVWQGRTYLLPACQRDERGSPLCYPFQPAGAPPFPLFALADGTLCDAAGRALAAERNGRVWQGKELLGYLRPPPAEAVHAWAAAILAAPPGDAPALDRLLAGLPRALQTQAREKLPAETRAELEMLRCAPVVINWDAQPADAPLTHIRRGRRGIGDHALTIHRTERSVIFDQSHIFFDGLWGMATAEVMTAAATRAMAGLARARPPAVRPVPPLALRGEEAIAAFVQANRLPGEAAAESHGEVDMQALARVRRRLRQRGVSLTINDLLLLYRFFHATIYRPSARATQAIEAFHARAASAEARAALRSIEETLARFRETNPALLIPMDASYVAPRERIFPATFRNPLVEIKERFAAALERYGACVAQPGDAAAWAAFDQGRRELLAYLKAFGELLDALKAVTMRGENFNTATIRLLAHLPASMQHLLDQIPQRIGVLNEIIKGNEVFSNVGRVAPGSSLARFSSAKDDGETKELVWGVLTDDAGAMHISLRDFRPFVPLLLALGEGALADLLARDYLDGYVQGLHRFVADLGAIVALER